MSFAVFASNLLVSRAHPKEPADLSDLSDSAIDWMTTIRRANDEMCAPPLWTALHGMSIPTDVRGYLSLVEDANARQNEAIRNQLLALGAALAASGLSATLLKGATWLVEDGPGRRDRMMRDIDLLVAAENLGGVMKIMREVGYRPAPNLYEEPGHIHGAPMICEGHPVQVEIHVEPTTRVRMLSGAEMIADGVAVLPGLVLPSPEHRLIHNMLHAQIVNGDFAGGVVSFRDTLDVARIADKGIDWSMLETKARQRGYYRPLSAALHKASVFAGMLLPEPFARDAAGARHIWRCRWQMRHPTFNALMRRWGVLHRALAWDRDAYAIRLGAEKTLSARIKVNRRRAGRILMAARRYFTA